MNHTECGKNKKTYLRSKKDLKRKIKIAKRAKDTTSINILKNELEKLMFYIKGVKRFISIS